MIATIVLPGSTRSPIASARSVETARVARTARSPPRGTPHVEEVHLDVRVVRPELLRSSTARARSR